MIDLDKRIEEDLKMIAQLHQKIVKTAISQKRLHGRVPESDNRKPQKGRINILITNDFSDHKLHEGVAKIPADNDAGRQGGIKAPENTYRRTQPKNQFPPQDHRNRAHELSTTATQST
jgi:hypothetical protein